MNIWLTRHGQTDLNLRHLMQGRVDEPLNETGREQARRAAGLTKDVHFDAVYASTLGRAVETASIISGLDPAEIITDERILEVDFGPYERAVYSRMGPAMTLFWALPELFPAPRGVETVRSMVERSSDFLRELESRDYENVLVVCHGGIIRALRGYLEDRPNGIRWRPKPRNCEIRVYRSEQGKHSFITALRAEK